VADGLEQVGRDEGAQKFLAKLDNDRVGINLYSMRSAVQMQSLRIHESPMAPASGASSRG
jgi:hypothetical protein